MSGGRLPAAALALAVLAACGVRAWNVLAGPVAWGYDAGGHFAYVLFLDLYGGVPWADQGWSYFHPPLHYALGWGLARLGSAEALLRGLPALASAMSVATAGLAAWMVRATRPAWPGLAVLGFVAVAFLPVHLTLSAMPGNELTHTALASGSLCAFVANDRRARPRLRGDALAGLLAGLALLTKFSGLLAVLVGVGTLALRAVLEPERRAHPARSAARAAVLAGVALAICAPYYARNLAAFGTPFQLSRSFPLVAAVEREQRPGERGLLDYLRFPLAVFVDPDPRSEALLHSVWGTAYADVWADVFRESDVERALVPQRAAGAMALAGLFPTALALFGGALAAGDVRRGRRRAVYLALGVQAAGSLLAFAFFAWRVPIWSALKASYLLGLSLPYAVALARGVEGIAARGGPRAAAAAAALVVAIAGAAAWLGMEGLGAPRRADAPAAGAVYFHFGEYTEARRIYGRLVSGARYPVPWLANLAAVELAEGRSARARSLYARAVELERAAGRGSPWRSGAHAVALAADGALAEAQRVLDAQLARRDRPALRANRGAVRAARGDLSGAASDLRVALAAEPELLPAWHNLARVLAEQGRGAEARRVRRRAVAVSCRAPRRYPHGLGTGEVLEWGIGRRWLLLVSDDGVAPALPGWYRDACHRARQARSGA